MAKDNRALSRGLISIALATWVSPGQADDWVIASEAVVNVKVSSDTSPIPSAFPAAFEQTRKLWQAHPKATQWLVNIDWPAAPTGVQFALRGKVVSFDKREPTEWMGQFVFNGGSEKGVVEAGRWCRGGAARDLPMICAEVEKAIDRRNVRHLVGK
ncbi:hypothetical protein BOSEA31B_20559 [Hyphomicrobiales bacterium]|nr:hypothetical protein BOSEA31B_20559 [Hyphomicrobiales bacterium]CAH1702949.1 hypothetical protein BOSEA1005_30821 [Hyphomicrobiales bacterium]CAI0347134.1 hypothetical protein BO1005MUT1_530310 [Hyphomicrobiales bacterium]